jgi:hypothetical protein
MRFANHEGRLTLISAGPNDELDGATGIDMHEASGGRIPADPELPLQTWGEVLTYARAPEGTERVTLRRTGLASPSPRPRQIFGIGVNYADHGAESGMEVPDVPLVFPKLSTAVAGPFDAIPLSPETVDWEVEIAVVIGTPARHVPEARAWDVVAGLTAGQDLSDSKLQDDPLHWRAHRLPELGDRAGARRCDLHRHTQRHWHEPHSAAVPVTRRSAGELDRGRRVDVAHLRRRPAGRKTVSSNRGTPMREGSP